MTHEEIILFTDFLGYHYIGSHEKAKYEAFRVAHNEEIKKGPRGVKTPGAKIWASVWDASFKCIPNGTFYPGWYTSDKVLPFHGLNKKAAYPIGYITRAKWHIDFKNFDALFDILNIITSMGYTFDIGGRDTIGMHRCEIRAGVSHQLGLGMSRTALDAMYEAVLEALETLADA